MILNCSACSTRYLIDPTLLGASGRMVRCARCGHTWTQIPPPDMPQPIDLPPPLTSEGRMPLARGTNLPAIAQQQTGRSRAIGWVFLILVLGLVGSGLVFGR